MDALPGPTDAELVARVLEADREAFATVYDRYGPKLYDFSYAMLRQREDAADAVADSFVTFAEKLPQLRDPDRLRPWLYAIARSECLRRLKARKRVSYGDDELLTAMPDESMTPDQVAEAAMVRQLVWDAAAGLADRDRALLDLHLRQGLEGAELGEAMGVSASNAYVMVNRLKAQVERSLGALLIARLGRDDCEELAKLLTDWDGGFSPLIRKRVARHVDGCEVCGERRTKILSPWALLAGVPVFVAPLSLRDRVLNDTQLVAYAGPVTATTTGATGSGAAAAGGGRAGALVTRSRVAAAAAVLVAASAVTAVVLWPDDPTTPIASTPGATTGSDPTAPFTELVPTLDPSLDASPTGPTSTGSATPTGTPTASSSPSATVTQDSTTLTVSDRSVDLGATRTTGSVRISNPGSAPLFFTARPDDDWLSVSPVSDTVRAGGRTTLGFTANRGQLEEGPATTRVRIVWNGGATTITVRIRQENAPQVGRPSVPPRPSPPSCTVPVAVSASDDTALRSVRLRWAGPGGAGGTLTMQQQGNRWMATIDPVSVGGSYTLTATATDTRGNSTTGPALQLDLAPCPQ